MKPNKRLIWARRASLMYAVGVWTMLGVLFAKWRFGDGFKTVPAEIENISETEKQDLLEQRKREREQRIQVLAEEVAELYTPIEFLA